MAFAFWGIFQINFSHFKIQPLFSFKKKLNVIILLGEHIFDIIYIKNIYVEGALEES